MDLSKFKQQVIGWIQEFFDKNYRSGIPRIPPHTHNGVDNLPVNSSTIVGGVVTEIVAGTNITISPTSGVGVVTINSSGGGGSPGGANTNVQFNDSGAFGGDNDFDWDKVNKKLILDDGFGEGDGGVRITGGNSDITLQTEVQSTGAVVAGDIYVRSGGYTGSDGGSAGAISLIVGDSDPNSFPNHIYIQAGNCGDLSHAGQNLGGIVNITAGNTGIDVGGNVNINSGNATSMGTAGAVHVTLGGVGVSGTRSFFQVSQFDAFGSIQPNIVLGNTASLGGGEGVIFIANATTVPSSNPTGGGILYVTAGALTYRGSGGTVTTIAPA